MTQKILLKRGNLSDLPTLAIGEPGITLDTEDLYIGGVDGNISITANKIFVVGSINELKNLKKKKGVIVSLGYYTKGDNDPVYYTIEKTGVADFGSCIEMNNGCYAKAIFNGGITPNTFGINDKAENLSERWSNYLDIVNNTKGLFFKLLGQRYKVSKPLNIYKDMIGVGGDSVLFVAEKFGVISTTKTTVNGVSLNYNTCIYTSQNPDNPEWSDFSVTIKNVKIECDGVCDIGILATDVTRLTVDSVSILDPVKIGLWCSRAWLSTFRRITIYVSDLTEHGVAVGQVLGSTTANTNLNFTNVYIVPSYNGSNNKCRAFSFLDVTSVTLINCAGDSLGGETFLHSYNAGITINGLTTEACVYTHAVFDITNTTLKLNAVAMFDITVTRFIYLRGSNKVIGDFITPTDLHTILFFDATTNDNYVELTPGMLIPRATIIHEWSTLSNCLVVWKYPTTYGYAKNSLTFTDMMV